MIDLNQTLAELSLLPVDDRLRVVESLWDSIPVESQVSVSPEQRKELLRRIEDRVAHPDALLTWDEVLDRLRERR
jgi:putative addiction module component (TIGR02574 family)